MILDRNLIIHAARPNYPGLRRLIAGGVALAKDEGETSVATGSARVPAGGRGKLLLPRNAGVAVIARSPPCGCG